MKEFLLLGYNKYKDEEIEENMIEDGNIFDFDNNCDLLSRVPKKNKYIKYFQELCYFIIIAFIFLLIYYCITIEIE